MSVRVADLVARYFPDPPSRTPKRLVIGGALVTAVALIVIVAAKSVGGITAGVVLAPFGLFPFVVGGVMWLRQRSRSHAHEKAILLAGAYERVEHAQIAVMLSGVEINRAEVVRVYAPRGRVIDLPVAPPDVAVAIAALRAHMVDRTHARTAASR